MPIMTMAKEGGSVASDAVDGGPMHVALFYRGQAQYLAQLEAFARGGLASAEPVFAAVPGDNARLLQAQLGLGATGVSYADMAELGRNPGRIIPAVRAFADAHPGRRVRYISEPIWPGRSAAETREATRYEALINLAFAGLPVTILCPYDAAGLAQQVLSGASYTHPALLHDGQPLASGEFPGPGRLPPGYDRPLPAPPGCAEVLGYDTDLRPLRRLVASHARRTGLSGERAADFVLAASEIAANTLRHTRAGGLAHVWHTETEIVCQVQDQGWISDPLAGQRRRPAGEPGQGLWLVNQVCDLVELRTGRAGTTVRLHMRR
jgi:anti-sigma regulatory factor (Ser/Thr protein kinase)